MTLHHHPRPPRCLTCGATPVHAHGLCKRHYNLARKQAKGKRAAASGESDRLMSLTQAQIDANIAAIVAASEANGGRPPGDVWEPMKHYHGCVQAVKVG